VFHLCNGSCAGVLLVILSCLFVFTWICFVSVFPFSFSFSDCLCVFFFLFFFLYEDETVLFSIRLVSTRFLMSALPALFPFCHRYLSVFVSLLASACCRLRLGFFGFPLSRPCSFFLSCCAFDAILLPTTRAILVPVAFFFFFFFLRVLCESCFSISPFFGSCFNSLFFRSVCFILRN